MIEFRNEYAAHRGLGFGSPVPKFDAVLAVAYYYDWWVREVISPDTFAEPSLEQFALALEESTGPLVSRLLRATKDDRDLPNPPQRTRD